MKKLNNILVIAALGTFVTLAAEARGPEPPPPPPQDQVVAPPWDSPDQDVPPGLGPLCEEEPREAPALGRRMGPGGRGRGAGLGQGRSGPMAGRQRALAGGRQGRGMQAQRGGRAGRGPAMGRGAGIGRGAGGKGAFRQQHRRPAMRSMRSGRGGQQFGPGAQFGPGMNSGPRAQFGRGGGAMQGRGRQFGQAWKGRQGQGRQFALQRNAGGRGMGPKQGMRAGRGMGRGVGRGSAQMRQHLRDGSCLANDSGQRKERLQQRIDRLRAQLDQLEAQLEIEQP
jgi:hypothetical protein